MKTLGWQTHTCLLITGGGRVGISFFQVFWVVYSTESREIEIRVCFSSDMDEEL